MLDINFFNLKIIFFAYFGVFRPNKFCDFWLNRQNHDKELMYASHKFLYGLQMNFNIDLKKLSHNAMTTIRTPGVKKEYFLIIY